MNLAADNHVGILTSTFNLPEMVLDAKLDPLDRIAAQVGHTPICEISHIPIPNGNRIFAKEEWKNPTGSHYDRIYLRLFRALEQEGKIVRGRTRLIEVSSGCAGALFASFCRDLGYSCKVILPADLPTSRIQAVRRYGAEIILSPAGEYIKGAVKQLVQVLKEDRQEVGRSGNRLYCLNHAEDFRSVEAMGQAGEEAFHQLGGNIDFFVGACGNGASLLGVGAQLKKLCTRIKVVSCDPVEAPVSFARKYPGIEKVTAVGAEANRHDVYGTGAWGVDFRFLRDRLFDDTIDDVQTVTKEQRDRCLGSLHREEQVSVGRSSALVLSAALNLCERVKDKTFLIVFYDSYNAYL